VLHVPALRDRREDLPTLVDVFVRQFARRYRKDARRVDSTTLGWLVSLPWPGNVRELQTVMERAVLHAAPEQTTLGRADFDWTATSTGDAT
jgi:DNA-binding NtrC family response regulator